MDKLDLSGKLSFDNADLTAPDIVVGNLVSQINDETNGIIMGNVETYDGSVISYTKTAVLSGLQAALDLGDKKVDIQDFLGKQGEESNKFEVYLTTPVFEQYQYRICFLQYGVANYPVKVVLEQSIADEINKRGVQSNYIYNCNNRTELEDLFRSIIYSKKVIGVMQELINIHQIHKNDN